MKNKSLSPPLPCPSFSLIPDEIIENCLARIPRAHYPRLSFVSKTFQSILSSKELYIARTHLGNTEQCLYICLYDCIYQVPQWFTLWINPNRTKKKRTKKTWTGQLLVPLPSSDFALATGSTVVAGSDIYVIGGPDEDGEASSAVRVLDCGSHTWRDAPSMNVARKNAVARVYDEEVYVVGGVDEDELSWGEVFDIKTQTWECLPGPDRELRSGISATFAKSDCVIDNVIFSFGQRNGRYSFWWKGLNGGVFKEVKGLGSLGYTYMRNGGDYRTTKEASCGGKLYVMWEGRICDHKKKIWCAEVSLEKWHRGEVWGNVEWVDVVYTASPSCTLMHFLAASA